MSKEQHVFTGVFIPAKIWLSKHLRPVEKMLLAEIRALSEPTGWCFASNGHFAEWIESTPQYISKLVSSFEKRGFLCVSFEDEKTHSGRKMKVNSGWYEGLTNGLPPLTNGLPPLTNGLPPLTNGLTEIQFKDTFKNTLSPAHENQIPLEAEKEKKEPAGGEPTVLVEIHDGEAGATIYDKVAPATTPPTHRIKLNDRPRSETPLELEISLRNFYTDWPNEWSVGIMENGRGSKYGKEKCKEIVKDFCCWAIENGRGQDTFLQLNARLQRWFRDEQHSTWKQQKVAPQPTRSTLPKNIVQL